MPQNQRKQEAHNQAKMLKMRIYDQQQSLQGLHSA
jgi:hypothetical protein